MQKTDAELLIEANIIKNETNAGANTATRVGVMLVDIVNSKVNNDSADGTTTVTLNTTAADAQVNADTINEITAVGAYNLIFEEPTPNKRITIVNTDLTSNALIDDTNTFAPYWNGSASKVTLIGAGSMYIFTSVNGKWRGGLMYD